MANNDEKLDITTPLSPPTIDALIGQRNNIGNDTPRATTLVQSLGLFPQPMAIRLDRVLESIFSLTRQLFQEAPRIWWNICTLMEEIHSPYSTIYQTGHQSIVAGIR